MRSASRFVSWLLVPMISLVVVAQAVAQEANKSKEPGNEADIKVRSQQDRIGTKIAQQAVSLRPSDPADNSWSYLAEIEFATSPENLRIPRYPLRSGRRSERRSGWARENLFELDARGDYGHGAEICRLATKMLEKRAIDGMFAKSVAQRDVPFIADISRSKIQICADSEESAEMLARLVIELYETGFLVPAQREMVRQMKQAETDASEIAAQVKDLTTELATVAESRARELSPQQMELLATARLEREISVAGKKARLQSLESLIKKADPSNSKARLKERLENTRLDMVELEAELDQIKSRIADHELAIQSHSRKESLEASIREVNDQLASLEKHAELLQRKLDRAGPLDIVDNQIRISPINWQSDR